MKTALITGASSGIGYELALLHARQGHDLILVSQDGKRLSKVKRELETIVPVEGYAIDLSKPDSAEKLFSKVKKKEIDFLINNAGFGLYGMFKDTDLKREEQMINLNMLTLTKLTKLFLPGMIKRGRGRILNVSSVAGFMPGPLMAVYYASKAYVLNFSEAISNELKETGVTVTVLCPGGTKTQFAKNAQGETAGIFKVKLATAKEVAELGFGAMMAGKRLAVHGCKNKFLVCLTKFLPRSWVLSTTRKVMEE